MLLIDHFTGLWIDHAMPLDKRDRRRVFRLAQKQWFKNGLNCTIYGLGLGISMMVFFFLPRTLESILGSHTWYITMIAFVVYLGMLAVVIYITMRFRFSPCIFAQLRIKGFDVCPRCGYWLKDLDKNILNCPECGTHRTPMNNQIG